MNNPYFKQLKISFFREGNELIYYLQKFPLTKKLVTDECYKNRDVKLFLSIINKIRKTILEFLLGCLAVFFTVIFPCLVFDDPSAVKNNQALMFHLMFWMFCIFGAFGHNRVAAPSVDRNDFIMLHVMHTPAKEYYMTLLFRRIIRTFADFFVLVFFGGLKTWLLCCAYVICFRCIGEAVHLFLYDRKKSKSTRSTMQVFSFTISFIIGEILTVSKLGNVGTYGVMTSVPGIILTVLAATFSCIYMVKYRRYRMIAKELVTYEQITAVKKENVKQNALKAQLVMNKNDEKVMLKSGSEKFENKKGYEYLTAIFFDRHRHLFLTKAVVKLGIVLVVAAVIFILYAFVPNFGKSSDFLSVARKAPAMIYWLFIMSSGQIICKALFYECDRVLLKFGYYRQGRAVLENFRYRIRYIILIDLIPSLVLGFIPIEIVLLAHREDFLVTACFAGLGYIAASVFFSVFHTMMYYIFQPFTEEMTEHGKAYKVINFLMILGTWTLYILSNDDTWTETSLRYFFVIFAIATVLFIPVSFILVYKLAPKRFYLK
ncbi:MAG: hypothetical protein ILP22_01190 [Oscillospiraceae bacterium]|nr:hypothetical protein [Oscillospiraceae bacterium]